MNSSSGTRPSASRTRAGRERAVAHREHLVGEAERVAHGAVGGARDHRAALPVRRDTFSDARMVSSRSRMSRRAHALEVEALKAAEHRRGGLRDLLRFGGGEDEHDARGRLLEDLEERVPRLAREHVRFVDDVDLVAVLARRARTWRAREVRARRRRRGCDAASISTTSSDAPPLQMRLQLVHIAARLAVRRGRLSLAVERHREHAGERGLADAARPAEQVAVRDAPARDRALERVRDVRLHGDVGEASWGGICGRGRWTRAGGLGRGVDWRSRRTGEPVCGRPAYGDQRLQCPQSTACARRRK